MHVIDLKNITEHKLKFSENEILRKIFGKTEEMRGG
jgi:hypothetical protein